MSHGYVDPGLGGGGQGFIVLAQPSAPSQPGQSSLHHPSPRQHLKLMAGLGTLHDLHYPAGLGLDPINQLPGVAAVSPNQLQAREPSGQFTDDQPGPIPPELVEGLGSQPDAPPPPAAAPWCPLRCAASSRRLLASIIAARPPFSVVLTLWLPMIAALGVASRPPDSRTRGRSASGTRSQVPSLVHWRKYLYSVCQGGRSWGTIRQAQPARSTYKMPLITSSRSTERGRPPDLAAGSMGARTSHCWLVRSLGYGLRFIHTIIRLWKHPLSITTTV